MPIADIFGRGDTHALNVVDPDLRISAQRALLGAISPEVRLVKVRREGRHITFTAICDLAFSDTTHDALTTAAAEIQSDFPEYQVNERISGSAQPLPREDRLEEGWVYQRAE